MESYIFKAFVKGIMKTSGAFLVLGVGIFIYDKITPMLNKITKTQEKETETQETETQETETQETETQEEEYHEELIEEHQPHKDFKELFTF
jgi:large-conductance mechanosensitive channel